jgi:Pro-kumamolisin, activation domain/Abnormal spindle-like microcephaly-assoc'd, ASPM-SPD-2-Hydin
MRRQRFSPQFPVLSRIVLECRLRKSRSATMMQASLDVNRIASSSTTFHFLFRRQTCAIFIAPEGFRMSFKSCLVVTALLLVSASVATVPLQAQSPTVNEGLRTPSRVVGTIDEGKLVALRGNVNPHARAEFDRGAVSPELPMTRIVMVLQRSPEQEAALEQLMTAQLDPQSPSFHQWLTPDEFGQKFGPSDADVATVTGWLQIHGFVVENVSRGRITIEFSGTAAQVDAAFHAGMHRYTVNGVDHIANSTDPQIPAALAPVVEGIASLHDFFPTHQSIKGQRVRRDAATGRVTPVDPPVRHAAANKSAASSGAVAQFAYNDDSGFTHEDITPFDFATIYNVLPVWNAGIKGSGQTIAISGVSDINLSDVATFQAAFGLPNNPPTIIHNGADPGEDGGRGENTLDVEWSGAVAPAAKIVMVVTNSTATTFGGQLSDSYIVDNTTATVMSASYGTCELNLGNSGNAAYNAIWQQGAALGISIFESSGDQGSAGCTSQDTAAPNPDTKGLQVNGMASSPFVTAVGGTDFLWQTAAISTYWNATNSANGATAKGYIPEIPWNSTCTSSYIVLLSGDADGEAFCNDAYDGQFTNYGDFVDISAGSGGVSQCTAPTGTTPASCAGGYIKPAWQTGVGVPADGKRDLPDVSLFASDGYPDGIVGSAYLVCGTTSTSSCDYTDPSQIIFQEIGGTSASSPAMAGIMALVQQKTGEAQGLINPVLYKFAAAENLTACNSNTVANGNSCIFYDTTSGTNAEVCQTGGPNCVTNTSGDQLGVLSGFTAAKGYDLATGLGSVNVANLVNAAWPTAGGGTPKVSLSATSLAFGSQNTGTTSAAKTVTLTNSGTAALSFTSIAVGGTNSTSFAQTNSCSGGVAASGTCTISVTFSPKSTGTLSAAVTLTDNAGTQTITLGGSGVAAAATISVSPTSIAFGNETVGVKSAAKAITVKNTSASAAITISSITVTGANTVTFAQTNNCPSSLAASATCTIDVTIDPTGTGARSASITLVDSVGTQNVALTGNGVAAAASISVSPTSIAFGNETVGVKSAAKAITVKNTSASAAITISSITVTGANTVTFAQTNNCPASLAASATCTVEVTIDPTGTGARSASITIADSVGTQNVALTGTGVAAALSITPTSLAFGNQTVGVKSAAKAITLKNTTTKAITISGIKVTGANTVSFAQTNNCPGSLGASATCTIEVTLDPTGTGARSADVTVTASTATTNVPLTGTGVN